MEKGQREKLKSRLYNRIETAPETPAAPLVEKITDTAPQGIEWEGLPAGIQDMIENAISDFCLYECKPPITDLANERAPRWSACCIYIGQTVYKKYNILTRGQPARRGEGFSGAFDYNVIDASIPFWCFYCSRYGKAPLLYDFMCFIGANTDYLYHKNGGLLTPSLSRLTKNLKSIQEAGLAGLISDGRGNPTGAIAILNHWHGWNQQTAAPKEITQQVISAASLPRLGAVQGQNDSQNEN